MSDLSHFADYAIAFELACGSDNWSLIEPCFAPDAVHGVDATGLLALDDHGRAAVVAGLRRSVETLDRRFDARIPELIKGPELRDGGVWMRFRQRMRRIGLPDLVFEGDHLTIHADGAITRLHEVIGQEDSARVDAYLAEHDAALRPAHSAPAPMNSENELLLGEALRRSLVRSYAAAKSAQDVQAALRICHEQFRIETVPFGMSSHDRDDTAAQLRLFFQGFPDYAAHTQGLAASANSVAWWGRITLTFGGELLGFAPTGKSADLPAFAVFEFRDGQLGLERFYFDLAMLCEQVGLDVGEVSGRLRALRAAP